MNKEGLNKEGTTYTIVFVFIVSFAFVFLLSLTNQATIERVELNEIVTKQQAVLAALGIEASGPDDVQKEYARLGADEDLGLYASVVGGEMIWATDFTGPGLWGTIEGILAVTSDLKSLVGIEIVSDNETPGLGGRINEPWFKDQFRGESVDAGTITVTQTPGEGDPDKSNSIIDGVTGATRTSDSIEAIVNNMMERLSDPAVQNRLRELEDEGGDA